MTKIINAKKRLARQYGVDLYGEHRSNRAKKPYLPGMHGAKLVRKQSIFSTQLKSKQILKFYYGLTERVLSKYARQSLERQGNTASILVQTLESRLDSVIFRSGFVPTIFAAKQLVSHGHVLVNGKSVNISSYLLSPNDVVSLKDKAKKIQLVNDAINSTPGLRKIPEYVLPDNSAYKITFVRKPNVEEVPYECEMQLNFIVEYYSK